MPNVKTCRICKIEKPVSEYHKHPSSRDGLLHECKDCTRIAKRSAHLKRVYGISQEEYAALHASQGGLCGICGGTGESFPAIQGSRWKGGAPRKFAATLFVDHSHETGQTRGLLCNDCNTMLGHVRDNPDILRAALEYLALYDMRAVALRELAADTTKNQA